MSEKLLVKRGLRVQEKELIAMQDQILKNLSRITTSALSIPSSGAVLTTKSVAGVLGSGLRVDILTNVPTVRAGTGLAFDGTYLSVPADTTFITGTFSNSTSRKVILHWAANTLEASTVAIATGGTNLTFSVDISATYVAGDYIRLSNSVNGNNGTFRFLSVSGTTAVLTTSTTGAAESGMNHSIAGKYFPGYPTSGTTDTIQHDSYTLTYEDPATYVLLSNEIYLATLAKDGSANITLSTDARVPLTPQMMGWTLADANVSTTAAIAESKIALSASTITAQTQAHLQNTDTYTTSSIFRVKGVAGPRVLTEDDLGLIRPNIGSPGLTFTNLTQAFNLQIQFYNLMASPDATAASDVAVPGITASWGVTGTGTYSGSSSTGTFSITSAHNLATGQTIASNALIDSIMVDSTGRIYKITANTAANPVTAFTVTVSVDSANSQPVPTNGAITLRNYAMSYLLNVVDTVTGNIQAFPAPVDASGNLLVNMRPNLTGVRGRSYRYDLVSANSSLTPTRQTLSVTANWGAIQGLPGVINVPSASITTTSTVSGVQFDWPAPANFDAKLMDYAVAYSNSASVAPTFYNLYALELTGGAGRITVPAVLPQVAWINVKVRDLSGNFLSDTAASSVGYPTAEQTNTVQVAAYYQQVDWSGSGTNFPHFTTQSDSTNVAIFSRPNFLGSIAIVGVSLDLSYASIGTFVVKARVWQSGVIANGVSSGTLSATGTILTQTAQTNLGPNLIVGLELVSGSSPYTFAGAVTIHYVNVSSNTSYWRPVN